MIAEQVHWEAQPGALQAAGVAEPPPDHRHRAIDAGSSRAPERDNFVRRLQSCGRPQPHKWRRVAHHDDLIGDVEHLVAIEVDDLVDLVERELLGAVDEHADGAVGRPDRSAVDLKAWLDTLPPA